MRWLMNFLRGAAVLTVAGPYPERLVNLCAQRGVEFWALEWVDENTVRLTARRRSLSLLAELAERVGCEVTVEARRGLPDFLLRFRTRYAFLAGLTLSLCAVAFLSRFVLTIEVVGNETVPTAVILSELRQLGVRPGVYGPGLDRKQLAQEALLRLDGLSWMGLNLFGTRLEVSVREVIKTPERVDEDDWYDIVSETDGLVTLVEAELGDPVVRAGDTVLSGEKLISGVVTLEPPKYSDLPVRYYQTHARGRVWARTWRTLTAAIPLEAGVKEYAGGERNVWFLTCFQKRIEIFKSGSISQPFYDKITSVRQASLPGGALLPLSLGRETLRAYTLRTVPVDREAAQALLEEQLSLQLERLLGEDGTVVSQSFSAREKDGMLRVTLNAECTEEIGREVPGTPPGNETN